MVTGVERQTGKRTQVPPRFADTLKRLTLELKEADRYLVFADLPQNTLEGLSEAVDHLRGTVWAVLNSTVDEFSNSQRASVLLTSHRIQQTHALVDALVEEIDAGRITKSTRGVEELRNALAVVYKKLYYLTTGTPAPSEPT